MSTVIEKAYAKVNLFLDVISRRADGFHDIKTVMHSISLCDEIEPSIEPSDVTAVALSSNTYGVPTDEKNLAVRAAIEYLKAADTTARVMINLTKNIPVAAGLAGGSSDAAATLRAMNKIFGKFTQDELLKIASTLGSDVPYCLVGGTALCEGRGEIITPISDVLPRHFVIAIGEGRVSTPWAYSRLDEIYSNFDGSVKSGGNIQTLYNIFESAVIPEIPEIETIKSRLADMGASGALMSGSGPSVFGIFDTPEAAKAARDALVSDGFSAFYATSV